MRGVPFRGAHALRENSKKEKGKIKGGGRARAKIVDFGKVPRKNKIGSSITGKYFQYDLTVMAIL